MIEGIKKGIGKFSEYGKLVMFSHTIFSFSFAAVAYLLASDGKPNLRIAFWAVLALLGARTGANALNRAIDAKIDRKNPRTANRQIPMGEISIKETIVLTVLCFLLLVISAWQLNKLCFILSPIALFFMCIYSYTKRFTWCCHLVLGITCAIAPVGAWLAVTGEFNLVPLLLGAVNCLWVAGFDIIYGSQDYEFDKANGLHSIPVKFGVSGGLKISSFFHGIALILLVCFGIYCSPPMGVIFFIGLVIVTVLMVIQHTMVKPNHLKNVNIASYSISQLTSLTILLFGIADIFW